MCTLASEQLEFINKNIKKMILQKIGIPGKYSTAITGLNFLCDYGKSKKDTLFCKPSIVVILQGSAWTVIEERKYYCEEKHYFFTTSPLDNYAPINVSGERPFLALFLTLEKDIISQLVPHIVALSRAESNEISRNVTINHMDVDLLNCFLRLVGLLDKPEQIHVRAPIIIREIHYVLLLGPLGTKLKSLSRHAIYVEKKFKYLPHGNVPVLSVNRISSNGERQAVRLRRRVHYGLKR